MFPVTARINCSGKRGAGHQMNSRASHTEMGGSFLFEGTHSQYLECRVITKFGTAESNFQGSEAGKIAVFYSIFDIKSLNFTVKV